MPYSRRSTYRRPTYRKKYSYRPRAISTKTVQKIAKREIKREEMKTHPLQWVDYNFTGGNVNTSPTMHSLVNQVRQQIITTDGIVDAWPQHDQGTGGPTRQATYKITGAHFQLRFQQDVENIESSNTFRTMFYSYIETLDENGAPIFQGRDIDQPPNTEYIRSVFFDKMRSLRAMSYDPQGTDEADPSPGTAIIKYTKKLNHQIKFVYNPSESIQLTWEENDLRWEAQSDTIGDGLQLYGFIRIYYRRMF